MHNEFPELNPGEIPKPPQTPEEYEWLLGALQSPVNEETLAEDTNFVMRPRILGAKFLIDYAKSTGRENEAQGIYVDQSSISIESTISKAFYEDDEILADETIRAAKNLLDYARSKLKPGADGSKSVHLVEAERVVVDAICMTEILHNPYDFGDDTLPDTLINDVLQRIIAHGIDPESDQTRQAMTTSFLSAGMYSIEIGTQEYDKRALGLGIMLLNAGVTLATQPDEEYLEAELDITMNDVKEAQIDGQAALFGMEDINPDSFH